MSDKIGGFDIPETYNELLIAFKELYGMVDNLHKMIAEAEQNKVFNEQELKRQRKTIMAFSNKMDNIKTNRILKSY